MGDLPQQISSDRDVEDKVNIDEISVDLHEDLLPHYSTNEAVVLVNLVEA